MLAGDRDAAVKILTRVVKAHPNSFEALGNLGALHMDQGNVRDAERAFTKALKLHPDSGTVLSNLATLANQTGDGARAVALYRDALAQSPDDADIWHDLARIKRFEPGDPDLGAIAELRARDGLDAAQAMYADFALAKAYEDVGEYDLAFQHMRAANEFKWRRAAYDLGAERQAARRIAEVFDARFFAERMGAGAPGELPVLVLGMPRSGTTLVEQIVAAHPMVHGGGELDDLQACAAAAAPRFPDGLDGLGAADWRALGETYAGRLAQRASGAERVTDKMPRNFYFAGLLGVALPNARIIHCRRSALDTCLSCYSLHFPYGQEFTYDLGALGGHYGVYRQLMDHWHRVLPGRVLDVDYEVLVADQEPTARRLIEFCGLPWDPKCLDFHKSKRQVATASAAQVREPVHARSVARWRRFEKHLGPLIDALGPYAQEGDAA